MNAPRTDTRSATVTGVHDHDGVIVVELTGEVDMACDQPVRAVISEQLDRRPAGLVLDFTEVDFFGSTGIQLLVEAVVRAEHLGVALVVATDRRAVLRPLEITSVTERVDIHPDLQHALDALRRADVPTGRQPAHQ